MKFSLINFANLIKILLLTFFLSSCQNDLKDEIALKELEIKKKELELKEKQLSGANTETSTENFEHSNENVFSQSEVENFVYQWINFQNSKAINSYVQTYSRNFNGIKRTRSGRIYNYDYKGWIDDRTKMYNRTKYLNIQAKDVEVFGVNKTTGEARIGFVQTFESDNYSDQGMKIMTLVKDNNGDIKIVYEELVYSKDLYDKWGSEY